jgi:hypothetical protein
LSSRAGNGSERLFVELDGGRIVRNNLRDLARLS